MSALSNYAENKVLEHIVGKTAMPMPTVSIALYTTAPTDTDAGVEVSGTGYQRLATSDTDWEAANNGTIKNAVNFEWPAAQASWGSVAAIALVDADGNILVHGATNASKTIEVGDTYRVSAGNLALSMD